MQLQNKHMRMMVKIFSLAIENRIQQLKQKNKNLKNKLCKQSSFIPAKRSLLGQYCVVYMYMQAIMQYSLDILTSPRPKSKIQVEP